MDYFQLLDLKKEPFSNSPDPEFFYGSRQHLGCLQKLELSLRLRRGLNVVVADVGMGKTTLCRQLIRRFAADNEVQTHLLLDPTCATGLEFLRIISQMFGVPVDNQDSTERQLKEKIKDFLFRKGVEEKTTVALIIDEGQKLPLHCVELLREFLNYETNSNKLLQIVIFAQTEFDEVLAHHKNFADRVSLYQNITPLSYGETKAMVRFRLREAAEGVVPAIFSELGFLAVYATTGGYPRKIVELGYRVLLALIVQNKKKAGWSLVRACARRGVPIQKPATWLRPVLVTTLLCTLAGGTAFTIMGGIPHMPGALQEVPGIRASVAPPIPIPALPEKEPAPEAEQIPEKAPEETALQEEVASETVEAEALATEDAPDLAKPQAQESEPAPLQVVRAEEVVEPTKPTPPPKLVKPDMPQEPALTNMWGGRFSNYSQIVFWFNQDVTMEGPVVNAREAEIRFAGTSSNLAAYRKYSSFPGWVALKNRDSHLLARIGLPENLDGIEHFVEHNPFRVVVNLYHYQQPLIEDNS